MRIFFPILPCLSILTPPPVLSILPPVTSIHRLPILSSYHILTVLLIFSSVPTLSILPVLPLPSYLSYLVYLSTVYWGILSTFCISPIIPNGPKWFLFTGHWCLPILSNLPLIVSYLYYLYHLNRLFYLSHHDCPFFARCLFYLPFLFSIAHPLSLFLYSLLILLILLHFTTFYILLILSILSIVI